MSFLGGLGEMWNSSGGKVVTEVGKGAETVVGNQVKAAQALASGVTKGAEGLGHAVGDVAGGVGDAAKQVGGNAMNVATLGGYGRDQDQLKRQQEIIDRLDASDKGGSPEGPGEPGGKAGAAAKVGSFGPQVQDALDKGGDAAKAVSAEADKEPSKMATYTVAQGDALSKIAEDKGIDMAKLTELNPELAKDPNALSIGQELKLGDDQVPEQDKVAAAAGPAGPETPAPSAPEMPSPV